MGRVELTSEEAKKRFPYLILIQIEKCYVFYYSRYALSSGKNLIRSESPEKLLS